MVFTQLIVGLNDPLALSGAFSSEDSVIQDLLGNTEWNARPVSDKFREKSAVVRMMRQVYQIGVESF